ncbi:hypothetical protein [Rubellimicrobium arenae]|uniref:hypothetical protein n=1 Tax=Rubellimicrobium arenae TaxID=2817372 RepID=UPI001B30571F|nr:hypothetical protein [Rubellimicrobium arenae]
MSSLLSERDLRVMSAFPELFGSGRWDARTGCMVWGLMVGEGWRPLVLGLLEELAVLVRKEGVGGIHILQVKDKYEGLRVYVHPYTDPVEAAIVRAEARAARADLRDLRPPRRAPDRPTLSADALRRLRDREAVSRLAWSLTSPGCRARSGTGP